VDVEIGVRLANRWIITSSDESCSLHVNIHDNVNALLEQADNISLQGPITIAVNFSVLQEFTFGHTIVKVGAIQEMVIETIAFARTGLASRA
jgi:hypothetical protein